MKDRCKRETIETKITDLFVSKKGTFDLFWGRIEFYEGNGLDLDMSLP